MRSGDTHTSSASLGFWAGRAESFTRSLDVLQEIETTLSSLQLECEIIESISRFCFREAHRIQENPDKQELDPNRETRTKLLTAQNRVKQHHSDLIARRDAARADPRFNAYDGVVGAFSRTINAVAELHNNLNALRWAIGEHDAELSKVVKRCATVEALTAYLNTKRA